MSQVLTRDRYDKLAFKYVAYVAIPALAGYTGYSLLYESHKGWYSFVISTLTSFVYMFGFVSDSTSHHTIRVMTRSSKGSTCSSTDYQLQTEGESLYGAVFLIVSEFILPSGTERRTYADEGYDLQIAVNRRR